MLVGLVLGAIFVTPFVLVYFLFVRWCDRFEPEPWWLLFLAFVWGALFATLGGGISSIVAEGATSEIMGMAKETPFMRAYSSTVLAPVFEEGFKGFGLLLLTMASLLGLHELDGPLDGAIYGGIIGLGFTLTEDILYVASQYAHAGLAGFAGLLFLRTVLLGLSHCTFTTLTGLGFGIAVVSRSWFVRFLAPTVGLGLAMASHALHNGLPTFFGGAGVVVMILISWVIDVLFFVMLAFLVVRDRAIVLSELHEEVGRMLAPAELALVTTYVSLGIKNFNVLVSKGWTPFSKRRQKQLALVELAFVKSRRRRGQTGSDLDKREWKLRQAIDALTREGVWIGN